ncbi:hypothetical protein ACSX1A_19365 [Pontibacter sp. MBLB2868]|uniref:hypothetical protein n=1 Tax=Pontibacter sp. MBLB2868 TaxID=3451555 RepID=UPI003F754203
MSTKNNVQMFITVMLLALGAVCSLFQKDIPLKYNVELQLYQDAGSAAPVLVLQDVDTRTSELIKYEKDIKSLELTGVTVFLKGTSDLEQLQGEISFAEKGSKDFIELGRLEGICDQLNPEAKQKGAVIVPNAYASQKLLGLIKAGRVITFRLKATSDKYPLVANLALTIDSKMTVEI